LPIPWQENAACPMAPELAIDRSSSIILESASMRSLDFFDFVNRNSIEFFIALSIE
jgi:hypothetical protein